MLFSSIVFLFTFFPIVLLLYYLVPEKWKNYILLIASLIFYAWGEPIYIFLMLFSIGFNYLSGLDLSTEENERKKKFKFIWNIIVNLSILGFFKYYGFFLDSLESILHIKISYQELALPIGISFYTFQTMSYIIDVYRGKVEAQRNIVLFGVYVTMFPQLIAGPIVQYKDIDEQLKTRTMSREKFGEGTIYFIRGLSKKVLLANTIGSVFESVSQLPQGELSVLTAWIGCAAYTFQIYFDFSGYSDMAIGLGKMFGFEFLKNFDYPYISTSITEFWRRWHISLGSWFRDYVYIPLGGNRVPVKFHIRNIMVVWLLTGLWHGASWNFVVWGIYYGALLLLEKYFLKDILEKLPKPLRHIYSMLFVMIGWVLFFSKDILQAKNYIGVMFGIGAAGLTDGMGMYLLFSNGLGWLILILCSTPYISKKFELIRGYRDNRVIFQCVTYVFLFVLCIAYLVTETYNPFLYFRF